MTASKLFGVVVGLALACGFTALGAPAIAVAASPFEKLVFESNGDIYLMNPDGTGVQQLTSHSEPEFSPALSPDGTRVAFVRGSPFPDNSIVVMSLDGTGTRTVAGCHVIEPAWSPDGVWIAYPVEHSPCLRFGGLRASRADGTGGTYTITGGAATGEVPRKPSWSPDGSTVAYSFEGSIQLKSADGTGPATPIAAGNSPDWSHDGAKIAFGRTDGGGIPRLWTMNPDGTGQQQVPDTSGSLAAWSPDDTQFAFNKSVGGPTDIYKINLDGTGSTPLVANPGTDTWPDWEVTTPSYARPKGATPTRVSLSIAYEPCTTPDRTHGPPLAFGSCASPQMASDHLTVGTADANARPALNDGWVRLDVVPGVPVTPADEADVGVEVFVDDVFTKALADYTGELRARVEIQVTDRDNPPSGAPGASTTNEIPFDVTVGCVPVADPAEGSSCTASTTVDALVPGAVTELRRAIWQVGRIQVFDGGSDGDAQTSAGDTLFATQGLFVP